jgi:hypothetical protein
MASVAIAEDAPSSVMEAVPPLAWMAGSAALADLLINRVLIKLGHSTWSSDTLFELDRWGGFARNLSVVAALVAAAFCLGSLSSRRSGLPLSARAGIASFGWVLVPIVTLMTFLPLAWTRPQLVLVVAGLAHATILLLILAGLHWKSTPGIVAALVLTLVASLSGLASMVVSMVGGRALWEPTDRLSNAFRWSGELAYLAVPLAVAFALAIPWGTLKGKATLFASTMTAAVFAIAMAFWHRAVDKELPTMVYGAARLDLLPDAYAVLYAIPLGTGWAVTVAAAMSKDAARRQMGAALLLLLSAGYAPRTPSALIISVVGVALLARTAIAVAQRRR